MGNSATAIGRIRAEMNRQDRSYAWLARAADVPYKRLLAEVKHTTSPLALQTALAVAAALGITPADLLTPIESQAVTA